MADNFNGFIEVSAKLDYNVERIFEEAVLLVSKHACWLYCVIMYMHNTYIACYDLHIAIMALE